MTQDLMLWIGFHIFVFVMLFVDIGVFHRNAHRVSIREALWWSLVWIVLASIFCIGIWFYMSPEKALEFATGYVIEKSLSVDNLFVFLAVFNYFQVPDKYQHKVLYWGIIGALIFRAIFIVAGIAIISQFHFLIYVFGLFLVVTGIRLLFNTDTPIEPEKNPVIKILRRFIGVSKYYNSNKFFIRRLGYTFATPLFIVLVLIETTDIIFAVDSIPAILAISKDPFIVYTSNIFAILGLRTLYFALSGMVNIFHYLNTGMALVLVFIGLKMLLADFFKIPIQYALITILAVLTTSVVMSLAFPKKTIEEADA